MSVVPRRIDNRNHSTTQVGRPQFGLIPFIEFGIGGDFLERFSRLQHRVGTMTDHSIGLSAYLPHAGKRANGAHYGIIILKFKLPPGVAPYSAAGGTSVS